MIQKYMFHEKNMSGDWIKVNQKLTGFGGRLTVFGNNQNITALHLIHHPF